MVSFNPRFRSCFLLNHDRDDSAAHDIHLSTITVDDLSSDILLQSSLSNSPHVVDETFSVFNNLDNRNQTTSSPSSFTTNDIHVILSTKQTDPMITIGSTSSFLVDFRTEFGNGALIKAVCIDNKNSGYLQRSPCFIRLLLDARRDKEEGCSRFGGISLDGRSWDVDGVFCHIEVEAYSQLSRNPPANDGNHFVTRGKKFVPELDLITDFLGYFQEELGTDLAQPHRPAQQPCKCRRTDDRPDIRDKSETPIGQDDESLSALFTNTFPTVFSVVAVIAARNSISYCERIILTAFKSVVAEQITILALGLSHSLNYEMPNLGTRIMSTTGPREDFRHLGSNPVAIQVLLAELVCPSALWSCRTPISERLSCWACCWASLTKDSSLLKDDVTIVPPKLVDTQNGATTRGESLLHCLVKTNGAVGVSSDGEDSEMGGSFDLGQHGLNLSFHHYFIISNTITFHISHF
ncbi:hypothetical protein BLNAU_20365 [Blattamonas nauphoetae]|uniref:Uncharacterized protein n=1 Tax=Blattamonas nauphoetae TaxID=2049346 RepID=A0ABQ9WYZ7_9EUKA|nr:hypothetical protein BLNAU_20365 [Blattamonas nauphoetae]